MDKQEYAEYIKRITPKSKIWNSIIRAFVVGGLICLLGEGLGALYKMWLPNYDQAQIGSLVSCTLILLASILTGIGVYDKIGYFSGGGSIVPITGFSNSITSAAMEFRKEGIIFGTCANMFKIAGPVIVVGVAVAMLCGLGYFIVGLFL
ncbi:MAG: SpoVA/SpoVAEb family sporulation membrane protein [Clostridia bacterium]|nr:SpoVA/SpoVAEb family sporulation membrane protein [Clostridia bacterium]